MGKLRPKEGKKELPTVTQRVHWDWPSPRFSDFQPIASSSHHSLPNPLPYPLSPVITVDPGTPPFTHSKHPLVGPGSVESTEEKARGGHALGPLPREGSHSPLKHRRDLLTSLCVPPHRSTMPRSWPNHSGPHSRSAKLCQAFSLALAPPDLCSLVYYNCWSCHQPNLGPRRPRDSRSQLGYGKISLLFSSD